MSDEASARPRGRPPGVGHAAQLRQKLLAGRDFAQLAAAVWKAALAGDVAAQKLLVDRMVPAYRTQAAEVQVQLPAGTLTEQAVALLQAAADGELPADVASELIRSIGAVMGIEEGDRLRKQLDELTYGDLA